MSGEMVLFLVVLFTIAVHLNGIVSGIHIEVWPKVVNELVTDTLSVKCVPNESPVWTKSVLVIELGKIGQQPLAVLRQNHLTHGANMKDNMKAEGLINEVNITKSFLKISIKAPGASDGGQYECKLFYIDDEGILKEGRAHANVTVDNNNDEVVHTHLLQKLAELKTQFGDQQKETDILKKQLGDQQKEIDTLKQQRVTHEAQYKLLENKVIHHVTKESFRSAFLAGGRKSEKYYSHKTVIFRDVKLNIGGQYNPGTGVYTAPVDGLYVFHLLGTNYAKGIQVYVDVRVNGVTSSRLETRDEDYWVQSSMSVIVNLKAEDTVDCYVYSLNRKLVTIDNFPLTAFSGYLIKTM